MDDHQRIKALIKKSQRLVSEGKSLHAIQVLQKLSDEFPDELDASFELVNMYFERSQHEAAIKILDEKLEADTENRNLRFYVASLLFKNKCWDRFVEVLSFLQPEEDPIIYFFSGYAHFMLSENELARINLLKFINAKTDPEFVEDAFMYLARISVYEKKYDDALKFIKSAEELNKDHYNIHLWYAIAYNHLGMIEHSMKSIKKTLTLNKKDPLVIEWAGRIHFTSGQYQKALKYFESLKKNQNEVNDAVRLQMAICYLSLDNLKKTETEMNKVLKDDPRIAAQKKNSKE